MTLNCPLGRASSVGESDAYQVRHDCKLSGRLWACSLAGSRDFEPDTKTFSSEYLSKSQVSNTPSTIFHLKMISVERLKAPPACPLLKSILTLRSDHTSKQPGLVACLCSTSFCTRLKCPCRQSQKNAASVTNDIHEAWNTITAQHDLKLVETEKPIQMSKVALSSFLKVSHL